MQHLNFNLEQIANSGQIFRMNKVDKNIYSVVAFGEYVEIYQKQNEIIFSCSEKEYESVWKKYFDLDTDYTKLVTDSIAECPGIKDDDFLLNAIFDCGGIRILRQEFFETLISFIISQRKSIPAIKTCIEKLCKKFGTSRVGNTFERNGYKYVEYYTFPRPEELAKASIEDLKECGVGYRAEYIIAASKWYLNMSYPLSEAIRDYPISLDELMNIKGVGAKVANCICLFGLHQLEACPIDVWMQKIIDEEYNGIKPNWMKTQYAGLLQQYAFYYKRLKK